MTKIHSFLLALAFGLLQLCNLSADIIVGTDFENTTENGMALDGVTYMTNGTTVAPSFSSLTVNNTNQAQGNGNLFTTGAADGSFAVANNTGNGGIWNLQVNFTTGSNTITLGDLDFGWRNFGGNGNNQFAERNTTVTVDVLTGGLSVVGGQQFVVTPTVNTGNGSGSQNTPPSSGTQFSSIPLTGTLAANTTYTLFLQASDASTGGNNFGFDEFSIHGEVNVVPEPGSALLVGLFGLAATCRRRRG